MAIVSVLARIVAGVARLGFITDLLFKPNQLQSIVNRDPSEAAGGIA